MRRASGTFYPTFLAVVWTTLAVATAGSANGAPSRTVETEMEELKRRVVELQQKARVAEVEIAHLRQKVADLEHRLAQAEQAKSRSQPETTGSRPDEDSGTASKPILDDGLVEPVAPAIEASDLPAGELDGEEPPSEPVPAGTPDRPAGTPRGIGRQVTPEAQALYDEGYTFYHQKRYNEAEERFQRFLKLYANNDLGDNALFWVGECRYARGDFSSALEAFSATVERYPGGNKIPDALFKAGKCLEALGDPARARETYEEVGQRFPGSAAAALARERLDALH